MLDRITPEQRHKDEAAKAAGYRDWTHGFGTAPDAYSVNSLRAHAQSLANLEAARAELASFNAYHTEALQRLASGPTDGSRSGGQPPACPSCAAKDEAMAEIAKLADHAGWLKCNHQTPQYAIATIAARFITPPADPLAEALEDVESWPPTADQFRAILKARGLELSRLPLGGAK